MKRIYFSRLWLRIYRDREKKEIMMDELIEIKRWVYIEKNIFFVKM